ncbi:hypothetical protein E1B28_010165 [Marasmius oreades]|uniref:Uncharacterized protein n=1 Tax=Marasmius oreades TaxID=181124 RepID=A0A9P7USF5_9AGAR|nr:uncharacterized protein E1B28_010165 [Marasmius oreades]KAG7091111.1 hypothetical protein E1B28_010165 [Marasmius oreades]
MSRCQNQRALTILQRLDPHSVLSSQGDLSRKAWMSCKYLCYPVLTDVGKLSGCGQGKHRGSLISRSGRSWTGRAAIMMDVSEKGVIHVRWCWSKYVRLFMKVASPHVSDSEECVMN